MIYVCVQPDIPYFHWQIEVLLTNFAKNKILPGNTQIVCLYDRKKGVSENLLSLQRKYHNVRFFFYEDNREDKSYIPAIKPYGMYMHFLHNPIMQPFFYHDSDIIFKKKIHIDDIEFNACLMSDTISYIGYNYCKSKGEEQLQKMADIVGVSVDMIKLNQDSSGGAQYIYNTSNVTWQYWFKVYKDSINLYNYLNQRSLTDTPKKGDFLIQKWCAEMWATLWNLWYFNISTKVDKRLDFVFATALKEEYKSCNILHNAGVIEAEKSKMFFKGEFIDKNPFDVDLSYVDKKYCSYYYVQAIKAVNKVVVKKNKD